MNATLVYALHAQNNISAKNIIKPANKRTHEKPSNHNIQKLQNMETHEK